MEYNVETQCRICLVISSRYDSLKTSVLIMLAANYNNQSVYLCVRAAPLLIYSVGRVGSELNPEGGYILTSSWFAYMSIMLAGPDPAYNIFDSLFRARNDVFKKFLTVVTFKYLCNLSTRLQHTSIIKI